MSDSVAGCVSVVYDEVNKMAVLKMKAERPLYNGSAISTIISYEMNRKDLENITLALSRVLEQMRNDS